MEYRISELIGAGFYGGHRALRSGARELVEAGGRGSGKSSFLAIELLLQLLRWPSCHAVVVRKVAATLRNSVYAQLLWAMDAMGLTPWFKCSLSPLECEYLPTGQKILFFGMDDPGKLKSIKMPFGYIGVGWFEELDQFDSAEEVRSVEQSLFRGAGVCVSFKSFNPPANPAHWANVYARETRPGKHVHHSTYLQLPPEWLGPRFLEDAEHLKRVNPVAYRHEYLGEAIGTGDQVFANVRLETVDPAPFQRITAGVDWGWWPDAWAFNRVYYHSARRTLYIFDELTRHRTGNRETARLVRERVGSGETVIADSAEPKSVADYRAAGLRCRGAAKGPGSLGYSMKWLQSLEAIIIDPGRCPDTAKEFCGYAYIQGEMPDRDNHHIDAVRYATEPYWARREKMA